MFRSWLLSLFSIGIILATICSSSTVVASGDMEEPERITQDEALKQALEIFEGMSPEEMEETILEMMQLVGNDDPETKAELELLLNELIPQIKSQSNLDQMVQDDELAVATQDALRMLKGSNWDEIWAKQDIILEGVLASGQLTPESAALYRSDEEAWKEELKFIWDQLQKQAAEAEL
ncbi:unnamed protein product [Cylindrotheca closterium]|uniref:Calmodulin n=1 Tax=Cylindrotheca closterium TaxID=2856 RepID=A0AAD2FN70_9STRA|nr:unnamed protein product [Cylindrotheca closterium]